MSQQDHIIPPPQHSEQRGMLNMIFGHMPAWQRSILLFFIIPPMALAISGVLLQVNVGGILNKYIDFLYESEKRQTTDIDKLLDASTAKLQGDIEAGQKTTAEAIAAFNGRLDATERHLNATDERVGKIERFICDNDKALGFGACALDKPN